jgi:probable HAF family extracellular repeat protein
MNSRYVRSVAFAAFATLGILPVLAQAQLVDLGVATGYAINNAGQVALSTGIYSNGTVTALPALPGSTTPATPQAINASGQVAGYAPFPDDVGFDDPIAYINGSLIDIGSPILGGPSQGGGAATGINSSGLIVGSYVGNERDSIVVSFTYSNGTVTSLPFPCDIFGCNEGADYGPEALGINDSGLIVGSAQGNYSSDPCLTGAYAFTYSNGSWGNLGPGAAYAVNASGQVTGTFTTTGGTSGDCEVLGTIAFLYSSGTKTSLGTLPGGKNSTGYAINATAQIVGSSDYAGGTAIHAFFYNGAMNDLNTLISATDPLKPYVTLTKGIGITDSLLILVNGVDSRTNLTHAYLYQASFVQLAPATLDFAMLAVGDTSQGQSVTVTNTGATAIPIGTAYVDGDFSLRVDTCGTSLAAGGQCRIAVVFVPKVAGAFTGALTIPSAGANYQVPLSGVAPIAAKISASSSTATVGQPITLTWTVSAGATCIASSSTAGTPAFSGAVPVSGKQTLTEAVNGTVTYQLNCTAPGVAAVSASASVVWNWPLVTATISASPTTITAGKSTTLTWKSSNATSCTGTGGGPDDNWAASKATSGSQTVTEAFALDTSSVVLTFGITCNSTTSGLSDKASVNVTENQAPATPPPASSGGGGGALNPLLLAFLAGIFALRRARARTASR